MKPTRVQVAAICLDAEGRWSIDAPSYSQGGTVGYGTSSVSSGELAATLDHLRHTLEHFKDAIEARVKAMTKPDEET